MLYGLKDFKCSSGRRIWGHSLLPRMTITDANPAVCPVRGKHMIDVLYTFYSTNYEEWDPDNYVSCFVGRILSDDRGNMEKRIQVGEMNGYLFHLTYAREKHESLFHIFDDRSEDFAAYFKALFDKRRNDFRQGLLAVPAANDDILVVEDLTRISHSRGQICART